MRKIYSCFTKFQMQYLWVCRTIFSQTAQCSDKKRYWIKSSFVSVLVFGFPDCKAKLAVDRHGKEGTVGHGRCMCDMGWDWPQAGNILFQCEMERRGETGPPVLLSWYVGDLQRGYGMQSIQLTPCRFSNLALTRRTGSGLSCTAVSGNLRTDCSTRQ